MGTLIKTEEEIKKISSASEIVAKVHIELKKIIKPGVKLIDLDKKAKEIIIAEGAEPTFFGYEGYPANICTSVNSTMVHGVPNEYSLKEGDIISVDVGVRKNGYCGDAAFTMNVGEISPRATKLLETSKLALSKAIEFVKPGVTTSQLGEVIENIVTKNGFSVPTDFVGHGIGADMHEEPMIPNFLLEDNGVKLKEGMVICIEPMLIDGKDDLFIDPLDNWSVNTKHGGLTAHDEHTVLITKKGAKILSKYGK